jgi:hypothetical protein
LDYEPTLSHKAQFEGKGDYVQFQGKTPTKKRSSSQSKDLNKTKYQMLEEKYNSRQ